MAKQMGALPNIDAELKSAARALRHADVLFHVIHDIVSRDPEGFDLLSLCEIGYGIAARAEEAAEHAADVLMEVNHG